MAELPHHDTISVTQFALADHHDTPLPPTDVEWLWMDSMILRWLYGFVTPDIAGMVMAAGTSPY
jgi:hypothetical protein